MKNNINTYITLNKSEIRNLYQKKRLSLDEDYIEKHSKVICDNLLKTLVQKFKNLDNLKIALYFPANNEVDTKYFAEEISKEHKNIKILMPKIQGDILEFNEYTNESKIEYNTTYKSIIEIDSNTYYIPDIIVGPLVAFNKKGDRIGMGGGFYDRTIKKIRKDLKITFISVAYEVQKHDDIEAEVHDEKPNIIITESQNYTPLP